MKRRVFALLALALLISGFNFPTTANINQEAAPQITILSSDLRHFTLNLEFPEPQFNMVNLEGEIYYQIITGGCGTTSEIGKPELPTYSKLIRLPDLGGIEVSVLQTEEKNYRNLKILPAQPLKRENDPEPQFNKDELCYRSPELYPSRLIEVGKPAIWRNLRVAPVNFSPFQYNPLTGDLTFHRSIQIEITFTAKGENERLSGSRPYISEAFAPLYQTFSLGPYGEGLDQPVQRGAYLIITPPTYYNQIQEIAQWKERMGYYTYVATTDETGTTTTSIQNYIMNAYNTWEVPPEYIILIGDTDSGMPTFFIPGASYQCCTDLPYTLIEGDDYFPEILIGRLSVDNADQLASIINKINHYEKTPYLNEVDWYDRALMICDYSGAESTRMTKEFCEDQLAYGGYSNIPNCYYPGSSTFSISQNINTGVTFINYRGYGNTSGWSVNSWNYWDIDDINDLNNGYQTPVVTSIVCGGGNFNSSSSDPCFGEAWTRVGTSTQGKGAVAFCGPSEINTHTKWNNNIDCGIYWGIFHSEVQQFGPALLYGKMELWLDYPHNREGVGTATNSVGFYFYVYNVLGDPGLRMWTGVPQPITAVYNDTIPLGAGQFTITLSDTGGFPIQNAYVCLLKETEIYEGGFTDESGQITLPLNNYNSGSVKLTITGKNLIPLLQDIPIVVQNICLGIDSLEIIDNNSIGTYGNGDQMLSPAETAALKITIKNYGSLQTANNIHGSLSAASTKVSILQGNGSFGNLAPGAVALDTLMISLAPDLYTTDVLGLTLNLDCPQGSWSNILWADISTAEFTPLVYEYSPDTLEPGGQANIILTLQNTGLCNATNVVASLISLDPLVGVLSANSSFGTILSGAQANNSLQPFRLAADENLFPGHLTHLRLNFHSNEGYMPVTDFFVTVGTVAITDPLGPDDYGYYCFDSGDTGYIKSPTYNWINFTGTMLNLPDWGDEQDCRVTVDLPFAFTYYGEDYTQISVCSNGFIAMGNSDFIEFRNKAIPSAIGAPAMIAGFWDDLQVSFGSGVYKYDDAANHRFIIEYRNVKNDYQMANERFQIILYNPLYYPTPTGDGEIVIQYQDINDVDDADNYSTVGIEDYYHTTGLQYVFSDIYDASSRELADGLAIKFTTDPGTASAPQLELTVNPVNPPIIIPPGGGTFSFTVTIHNVGNDTAEFDFWTEAILPSGSLFSPILQRSDLIILPGAIFTRTLTQFIPASAPAGTYTYRGVVGDNSIGSIYDFQEFTFIKSAAR